jgi:uncharacterized protein DUF4124
MKRRIRGLLLTVSALAMLGGPGGAVQAEQALYKYIGPDGKTVYSDKPPPRGVEFEKLQIDTSPTGVDLRSSPAAAEEADTAIAARRAKEAEHEDRVANLQKEYDKALANLEAGKVPQEGERTQNANGTSRLNDNYFERLAELQRRADEARDALEAAKKE